MALTETDLEMASLFYPPLVDLGRRNEMRSYKAFLGEVQGLHPDNARLARAVPLNVGRRLEVIRMFTRSRGYPDLGCLIVSEATGEPGSGYDGDVAQERAKIAAFDWSTVEQEFGLEVQERKKAIAKRPKRGREAALKLMSDYFQVNKAMYDKAVIERRDRLIDLLMNGEEVDDAFEIAAGELRRAA